VECFAKPASLMNSLATWVDWRNQRRDNKPFKRSKSQSFLAAYFY
jgi:hypothetical protein